MLFQRLTYTDRDADSGVGAQIQGDGGFFSVLCHKTHILYQEAPGYRNILTFFSIFTSVIFGLYKKFISK